MVLDIFAVVSGILVVVLGKLGVAILDLIAVAVKDIAVVVVDTLETRYILQNHGGGCCGLQRMEK